MAKFTFGQIAKEVRLTYNGDKTDMPIVGLEHIVPKELTVTNYDINTNNTFTKSFKKGQILFGRRRAYQHKAAIATFNGICSGDITVIEPIEGMVYPALLPFIVQNDAFFSHAVQGSAGSLSPRVKWEHLSSYEIELPSIEEQRVLAEKLWAAYRLKESYKRLLAATDEMIKSQFIEMTTRSELNKKSIGEIAEVRTGSTPSRSNPEYWNGTHYWVSAQDMGNKYIYDTLEKITDKGYATCKVVPAGSILYVCRGSIGVMSINTMDCATNQSICTATCKTGYNTEYLYYALKVAEKAIKKQGIGTSFKSLNQSAFASIEILFPAIEIQDKFATIAKQADKSKFVGFKSQFIEMFKNIPSVKIADCCITVSGGTPNTKKIEYYDGGDIPWLSSGEINQGYIFSTDKYITQLGLENSSAKWVPANSVVIAMYGATAGKVGFIKIPLTTNQAVCTLLPNDGFEPLYLYYATLSKTSWMISQCRGAAQPNISQSIIRSMEIPMATIDEQKRFCKLLTQADKSKYYN